MDTTQKILANLEKLHINELSNTFPKYKIEGNLDFYSEINNNINEIDEDNVNTCLITGEPVVNHYQTLQCGHIFNYIPLYLYVKKSKYKFNYLEQTPLKITQLKCPYCRNVQNELLPYIEEFDFPKIPGVNHLDIQYKSFLGRCSYVNHQNIQCVSNRVYLLKDTCLCYTHRNIVIRKNHKKEQVFKLKMCNINNEDNIKKDQMLNLETLVIVNNNISDIEPTPVVNACIYIYVKGTLKGCFCNKKIGNGGIDEKYCKQHKHKNIIK